MTNTVLNQTFPPDDDTSLRIETRFGEFEADRRNLIDFPSGLPGFEQCRHFVIMSSISMAPLQCLHAVDGTPASFLVIDPRAVLNDYRCVLSAPDRMRLGAEEDSTLLWLAMVTLGENGPAHVNLRAPIVINPARMVGFQVMPHDSLYPVRHPLGVE
jgi:flagellar assembly factor FliW